MGVFLIVLCLIQAIGSGHVLRSFPHRLKAIPSPPDWLTGEAPRAAMIVPATGNSSGQRRCLQTLLEQDYPNHEVVFVTKDEADPATAMIRDLIKDRAHARHVLAGPAATCGQKNHNLLAGIDSLEKSGDSVEILVTFDANHMAHAQAMSELIKPIYQGKAKLTSGYHRIVPQDAKTGTLGMLLSCQIIHLLQGFPPIAQPWGGATAIVFDLWKKHGVREVWQTNIVDDFSMGPHLVKKKVRTLGLASACLTTPLSGRSVKGWLEWFIRQLQYAKFCTPIQWFFGFPIVFLTPLPLLVPLLVPAWGLGLVSQTLGLAALAFTLAFACCGLWSRALVPERPRLLPWLAAYFLFHPGVCACYLFTWTTNIMAWRGIAYRVGWGGRVREIILRGQS